MNKTDIRMKKLQYYAAVLVTLCCTASCSERYAETWDSLYYTDQYGERVCRMYETYTLNNDSDGSNTDFPFSQPIAVYYSGSWTAEIVTECGWGYVDRAGGKGVHYIHFTYLQNSTGEERYAILRIKCDNGESVDITLTQKSI